MFFDYNQRIFLVILKNIIYIIQGNFPFRFSSFRIYCKIPRELSLYFHITPKDDKEAQNLSILI